MISMQSKKYCYPNSDVLINKLNVKIQNKLNIVEMEYSITRLNQLQSTPVKGEFDFEHLKRIHHYIFQDIYEWAGKERRLN